MRLAPPSETPRRLTPRRGGGSWIAIGLLFLTGSCFFKLAPVVEDSPDSGLTGVAGSLGGGPAGGASGGSDPGGATNVGGSAGVSSDPGCPVGHKRCDDGRCLVPGPENGCGSPSCNAACPTLIGAVTGCKEDQCAIIGCQPGFADCDGDSLNKTGAAISGNGCEYPLGAAQSTPDTLGVPFAAIRVDGERDDWAGLPLYPFKQLCANCKDDQTPPISADAVPPPTTDLDAYWRVAWDGNHFYVFVEAYDDHLFDQGTPGGKNCNFGAECEDSVQVFFDGLDNRAVNSGYGNDDHRVFIGLSQHFAAPAQGQPDASDVEVVTKRQGTQCYRIEAQFDWKYITGTKGGGSAPGKFPAAANQTYGFDIAVNDWDPPVSDPNGMERQSQDFWVNPGPEYSFRSSGLGPMKLLGPPPDAGQQ
jgi:hypothetical protein